MLVDWLLALVPLLVIVALIVRFRWGAARAGPAGWLVGVALAVVRFGVGPEILAQAQAKAFFHAFDVLMIVWGAFLLYRVVEEAGAIRILSEALRHLTHDRSLQALLIGWAFASFLQGVGGFGVPVVVTAPILLGLGFSPLTSILIPSVGHSWSVTFGSLAASFQALIAATGLPGESMAASSALLLGLAGVLCGALVSYLGDGWRGLRRLMPVVLVLGAAMGSVQFWLATHRLWNIAGLGGSLAGLMAGLVLARVSHKPRSLSQSPPDGRLVWLALSGYLALIAITLTVQLLPPVHATLSRAILELSLPAVTTTRGFTTAAEEGLRLYPLRHAGAVLVLASLVAYLIFRRAGWCHPGAVQRVLLGTARGVLPSSLSIVSMVSLAVVMTYAGMTDVLARGLAQLAGPAFPLMAPWIGALGAFVTGSNTGSNLLFAMLQMRTAELLRFSLPWVLAAQTAGGAVGSVVAPTKIVVGVGSADRAVEEGEVMRHLLVYAALLTAAISLMASIAIRLNMP